MQLLDEIVAILSSERPNIENALIKAQILAHKLGEAELGAWVESELRGYSEDADLPPYRFIPTSVRGVVTNGVYRYNDQALPTSHLPEKLRDSLERTRLRQSISVIASWGDNQNLSMAIAPELSPLLGKVLDRDYWVESAWGKPSHGAMLQILAEVRSRLLDFALKVGAKLPVDVAPEELKQASYDAAISETFRNAVFGDNATIVIGSGSIQNVQNSVVHNDFASLSTFLRSQQVADADIQQLREAIDLDSSGPEVRERRLGPRVRQWISDMSGKAGTSGWNIAIGAAGTLLAGAIARYYGFGA